MNGVLAIVAATLIATDVGWQPLPDGGFEYIIQIKPQSLNTLESGQDISSQLPPRLRGMRGYRITVGNAKLPHQGEPPPVEPATPDTAPATNDPGLRNLPPPPANVAPDAIALPGPDSAHDSAAPTVAAPPHDTAGITPPPALDADPLEKDLTPRTAGYMQSSAAIHADKGGNQNVGDRMAFPGGGSSSAKQAPRQDPSPPHPDSAKASIAAAADTPAQPPPQGAAESKPWLPLFGTVLALFASLGANVYLGWNTLAMRSRFRSLASQMHVG